MTAWVWAWLLWEPFGFLALWILFIAIAPLIGFLRVLAPWLALGWHTFMHYAGKFAEWSDKLAEKLGKKLGVYGPNGFPKDRW